MFGLVKHIPRLKPGAGRLSPLRGLRKTEGKMKFIFWFSLITVFYVYIGYPVLLAALRRIAGSPVRKAPFEPAVTRVA